MGTNGRPGPRRHGRLLILVEAVTGSVLLFQNDITRWMHPDRYRATAAVNPMSQVEALQLVQGRHPELNARGVQLVEDVYLVRGPGESWSEPVAFVDPGSGTISAVGTEHAWFFQLLVNVHDCALGCEGYPLYQAWIDRQMPGTGADITIGNFLLSGIGVLLIFIVVGGVIIWWPPIRRFARAFRVRRGRGGYVRDLDLHKIVGIIAVPFLFMWGFTAAAFYFEWPEKVYAAALPGSYTPDPATLTPGTGPLLTYDQARQVATDLHPNAEIVAFTAYDIDELDGYYRFSMRDGIDPYRHSYYGGSIRVSVDSHGGGVQDSSDRTAPALQRLWDDRIYNGLHYGSLVSTEWRLIWLVFGLTPVILAITGVTVWLTKWRSRRHRRRAAHKIN